MGGYAGYNDQFRGPPLKKRLGEIGLRQDRKECRMFQTGSLLKLRYRMKI